jgi:hypothetical protein
VAAKLIRLGTPKDGDGGDAGGGGSG